MAALPDPMIRSFFACVLALAMSLPVCAQLPAESPAPLPDATPVGNIAGPAATIDLSDAVDNIATIDLTTPPTDLWQRIRNGFAMPDLEDRRVTTQQAWFLNRPATLKVALQRSRRYLHHIVEELEKRGMPTELALLPIIESSYNPQAYSHARALGMWQFIPSTGKVYNLKQNWWLDERRDIIASTDAALDYLQNIYQYSGDWHLALASYNWGEGAVGRAVAKNQAKGLPTDYLSLKMPEETRYYVPKLQAVKNIIADPALFGFVLDPIPNEPYFGTVDINNDLDVRLAANLAEIPLTEFIALNPAYSRPVIQGTNESPLVLPANKVQTFLDNLQSYSQANKPLSHWLTYTLKPKESLDRVAKRNGISTAQLKKLNGITRRTRITSGMTLLIPGEGVMQPETLAAALPSTPDIAPKKPVKRRTATRSSKKTTVKATNRKVTSSKAASKTSKKKK